MERWLYGFSVAQLNDYLGSPGSWKRSRALRLILHFTANYYRVTVRSLRKIGQRGGGASPADAAAGYAHEKTLAGTIGTKHQLEDATAYQLDLRLVEYGASGTIARERMTAFFYSSLSKITENDREINNLCRDEELRDVAFSLAFNDFIKYIMKPGNKLQLSGRNLFFDILRKKCKTQLTRKTSGKARLARAYEQQLKDQLAGVKFTTPPEVDEIFEREYLGQLRLGNEACYRLLQMKASHEYEELEKVYNTSVGALRQRVSVCRKKLWAKYQQLKNNPL